MWFFFGNVEFDLVNDGIVDLFFIAYIEFIIRDDVNELIDR